MDQEIKAVEPTGPARPDKSDAKDRDEANGRGVTSSKSPKKRRKVNHGTLDFPW